VLEQREWCHFVSVASEQTGRLVSKERPSDSACHVVVVIMAMVSDDGESRGSFALQGNKRITRTDARPHCSIEQRNHRSNVRTNGSNASVMKFMLKLITYF
jgi:hypothetical protein